MKTIYNFYYSIDPETRGFAAFLILVFAILIIISLWKIFQKAGESGWKSIIPIYNVYILYKITWGSGWFFLLSIIPFVGFIMYIMTSYKLAKVFGKGFGYTLGLIFFPYVFQMILAFGKSEYQGV